MYLNLKALRAEVEEAIRCNHRRLFVLEGDKGEGAAKLVRMFAAEKGESVEGIYVGEDLKLESPGKARLDVFTDRLSDLLGKGEVSFTPLSFEEVSSVLGTTWDFLVLDLNEQLSPDDLGVLVETVRGGGIIAFLTPPLDEWVKRGRLTRFQKSLIVPPYSEKDVKFYFLERFIRKLKEHDGIWVLNFDKGEISGRPFAGEVAEYRELKIPSGTLIPREIYSMCKTMDQIEALKRMEKVYTERGDRIFVLLADRGRGKTVALGLGVAGLSCITDRLRVLVTSPDPMNVQVLFEYAEKALKRLGVRVSKKFFGDLVVELKTARLRVEYWEPSRLVGKKGDLVLVDEAAGLPVPLLFKVMEKYDKIVYSSTIHGYEGAGRGFGVRFLGALHEKGVDLLEYEMEEPIRYAPNDPIEEWLYDTLLLDAEPVELSKEEVSQDLVSLCKYLEVDIGDWFLNNEEKLREFFGIYVMAHYRNRPSDLAILSDAPHHKARAIEVNGKIVASIQIAEEGGLSREWIKTILAREKVPGNLIPDRIIRHFSFPRFGSLRGWRIVRIAVHPEVQSRGIGSEGLREVCREATIKGVDWVGASFGASEKLLRFWLRNGFIPVHMTPKKNPVSGEYSIIVIKPLSGKCREVVRKIAKEFKLKMIDSIMDPFRDLEVEVARLLFKCKVGIKRGKIGLTGMQWRRIRDYALREVLSYEAAADLIRRLSRIYFLDESNDKPELTELQEKALIAKCLQGKSIPEAAEELKVPSARMLDSIRSAMKQLVRYYGKNS